MKLIEFVQEGVFDKVKAKPSVKMRLKDLTQSNVQRLSDEEFHEQLEHFAPRRDRIWRSVSEINKKIREVRKFSNDFTNTKGKKGFARDPHSGFKDRWVRVGSEGERLVDKLEGESEVYSQKYGEYSKIGVILVSEKRRRDTLRKKEGRKQAAGNWPDFQEKHPENTPSTIPPKIARTSGLKPSLANPYFGRKGCALEKQYAGHPAHYPYWSNDWKRRIIAVDELLTRNGKQGLELMYAGTFLMVVIDLIL